MNVLSLFDGMSCGQLALNRAGISYTNYYASEIDKYAIKVTHANYPNTIQLGDITQWQTWNLPKIDLIIGGSPCQGFSFAGKQLNFNDPRSRLFFTFVDILRHYQPRYFLLENVKMKKESEQVITEHMGVEPIMINSALVSAQNRKRLYWTNIPNVTQPEDRGLVLKDILEDSFDNKYYLSNDWQEWYKNNPDKKKRYDFGTGDRLHCFDSKADALRSVDGGATLRTIIKYNNSLRKLTPIETERLQTVPDNYTNHVSDTQRYKMLGNGWTIDIIAHIFKGLK